VNSPWKVSPLSSKFKAEKSAKNVVRDVKPKTCLGKSYGLTNGKQALHNNYLFELKEKK